LVIARKVIKEEFEWTFGYLLMIIDSSFSSEMVVRVITSKNDQFIDPVHEVPLDMAYLPTLYLPFSARET